MDKGKNDEKDNFETTPIPLSNINIFSDFSININNIITKDQIISKALLAHSKGDIYQAKKYYKIFIDNKFVDHRVFSNYGKILKDQGDYNKAIEFLEKAIEVNPNHVNAYLNLSCVFDELGELGKAQLTIRRLIQIAPESSEAYYNLASLLIRSKDFIEAESYIRKSIKIDPTSASSHLSLAILLRNKECLEEALVSTQNAIKFKPIYPEAYYHLSLILNKLDHSKAAESSIRKCIKLNPHFADAHLALGHFLSVKGCYNEALISTQNAIDLKPDYFKAYLNLGSIYLSLSRLEEAEANTLKAINIEPSRQESYLNLGTIYIRMGLLDLAQKFLKKGIEIDQGNSRILAEYIHINSELSSWDSISKYYQILSKIEFNTESIDPFYLVHLEDNPALTYNRAINHCQKLNVINSIQIKYKNKSKIHIGYFSADFNLHPIMTVIARMLELHDKEKFNIYAYYFGDIFDEQTRRVQQAVTCFRSIRDLTYLEIVDIARKDNLDVAIDLMGHSKNNRLRIFSYRVSPIQIHYLGGTTGLKNMDYFLADKIVVPEEYHKYYSERIIYKSHSFMCFDNTRRISKRNYQKDFFNLPEDSFVMAAFHKNYKITLQEINCWAHILNKVSNAVIWISDTNYKARNNITDAFVDRGVELNKIIFTKKLNSYQDHLARHLCADIFVDTFNFNASTTAIDSLWTGLPLVTKMGKSFTARTCASLLYACGLSCLVASSVEEYEHIILDLANNPFKLLEIKAKLLKEKEFNPLFDSERNTREIEDIYTNLVKNLN